MTQQQFQPQTQGTGQQSQPTTTGMSMQGTGSSMQQGMGHQGGQTTNNTLPDAYWTGLTSVAQAVAICEFCADQCIQEADPMMIECIKLCEDVADIGKSVLSLVPHESRNAQPVIQAFQQAAQACAQECGQHQHAHCQECAQVLSGTLEEIPQLTGGGGIQQGGSMGMQSGGVQSGGMETGGMQSGGMESIQGGGMGPSQF